MVIPRKIILEFDSFKLELYQNSNKVLSYVSHSYCISSNFESEVFGMTLNDFTDLPFISSLQLKKYMKVDIKGQKISFSRGLSGGGSGIVKSQLKFDKEKTTSVKKAVNRICDNITKGYIRKDDVEVLEITNPFIIEELPSLLKDLYLTFFNQNFFKSPSLIKEREKISRIMTIYIHASFHSDHNRNILGKFINKKLIKDLDVKIEEIRCRKSFYEQKTINNLQTISDLLKSGTNLWKNINKKQFGRLSIIFVQSSNDSFQLTENEPQTIIGYLTDNLRSIDNKDLGSIFQYILKLNLFKTSLNSVIDLLLSSISSVSETKCSIIIDFLALCFEKDAITFEKIGTLLDNFNTRINNPENRATPSQDLFFSFLSLLSFLNENEVSAVKEKLKIFYQDFRFEFTNSSELIKLSRLCKKLNFEPESKKLSYSRILEDSLKNIKFRGFIGREKELETIDGIFFNNIGQNNDLYLTVDSRKTTIILYGDPGIGKTALAYKYMSDFGDKFKKIFIFDYSTVESLESDIFQCLAKLEIEMDNGKNAIYRFKEYLKTLTENILIFIDNLSILDILTENLFVLKENIFYLVTSSTINESNNIKYYVLNINQLLVEDSIRLFKLHHNDFKINEKIKDLALKLKNLPIFIRIAASLVGESCTTIDDLLSIDFEGSVLSQLLDKAAKSDTIKKVLSVLSLFEPRRIPKMIIRGIFDTEELWAETRFALIKNNLVTEINDFWEVDQLIVSQFQGMIEEKSLNKVVQKIITLRPDLLKRDEAWDSAYFCYNHVLKLLNFVKTQDDRLLLQIFVVQFRMSVEKRSELDTLSLIKQAEESNNVEAIKRISKICIYLKDFKSAKNLLEMAEPIATQRKLNENKVEIHLLLGRVYSYLREFEKSHEFFEKYEQETSENSIPHKLFQEILADDEFIKEKYKESIEKYNITLEYFECKNEAEYYHISSLNLKIAKCFLMQKEYDECTKYLNKSLTLENNALDRFHPLMAEVYQTQARILFLGNRDFNSSLSKFKRCLILQGKTLGAQHYDIALTHFYMAELFLKAKNYRESEESLKKASTIMNYCQDFLNSDFENVYLIFGIIAFQSQKFKESINYLNQSIEANLKKAPYCKKPGKAYFYLGNNYLILCDYYNAQKNFEKCINMISTLKASTPIMVLKASAELLRCYYEIEEPLKLKSHLDSILKYLKGTQVKERGFFLLKVGECFMLQENLSEAEKYFTECKTIIEENKINQVELAEICLKIGEFEMKKNDINKAEKFFVDCYEIRNQELDSKHLKVAEINHKMGEVYVRKNEINSAKKYFNNCLEIRENILEKNSLDLISILVDYGSVIVREYSNGNLRSSESFDSAQTHLNRAFEGIPKSYISHRPLIIRIHKLRGDNFYFKEFNECALTEYIDYLKLTEKNENAHFEEICIIYERIIELYDILNYNEHVEKHSYKYLELLGKEESKYYPKIVKILEKLHENLKNDKEKDKIYRQIEEIKSRYNF